MKTDDHTDSVVLSFSIRKRWLRLLVVVGTVAAVAFPAGMVFASHNYPDVDSSNVHHSSISAITQAGVTQGCGDGKYCPKDVVRRDEMASFMDRLGALSGQTPSVNADQLDGLEASDFVQPGDPEATNLWAYVDQNTNLVDHRGVASITRDTGGLYRITFDEPLGGCAAIASISATQPNNNLQPGQAAASPSPGLGPDIVSVATFDSSGSFADRPFTVSVVC